MVVEHAKKKGSLPLAAGRQHLERTVMKVRVPQPAHVLGLVASDFELFEARAAGSAAGDKAVDPVCGMELGASEVAVSLTLDAVAHSFCSEDCLRKFVVSPERYKS